MKKILLLSVLALNSNAFSQTLPGNYCGATQHTVVSDFEMPLRGTSYYFTGRTPAKDKVNIGYNCSTLTTGKVNIYVDTTTDAFSPDAYGLVIENHARGTTYSNIGAYAESINLNHHATLQTGFKGLAEGGQVTIGVEGIGSTGGVTNQGGAFGGRFTAFGPSVGANYGVYGNASGSTLANYAGYFDGDVVINAGTGTYALTVNGSSWQSAGTTWATSDRKFKRNITQLVDVTEKIKKLNGYSYSFKTEEFPDRHFDKAQHLGFIAQELKEVFPQLVTTDPNGDLAVDYQGMIPVLLESIKAQQKQLDAQQELINQMLQKSGSATGIGNNSIGLTDFAMEQNEPNPFTHETLIRYTLPESVNNSFLCVYDLTGKQVTSFPIIQKGTSSITITSEKLSPGIYIYSIVTDGKVIDSKRMIIADK